MIRTQIQLPDNEYERLRELSARLRRSISDCIREGIRMFLSRTEAQADDLSDIAGKFRPLQAEDLKPHDRWYVEAVEAGRRRRRKA